VAELQYLILDRIAVGGMAEVFRAKSLGVKGFEKIVAIKRILPQLSEDQEFVQMFVEEAKIAGRLRHANIARILELGKIEGTHFIAMEYIFGKDLVQIKARLLEEGRSAPPKMAAWVMSSVLAGLDYAHRQVGSDGRPLGLIHRDVSPQNVLVSHDGQVKLIDFGIAKAASRATQTVAGVIKGKLGYMSPEQVTGRPIDHRSDIFAASTCLHEILTGERLFTKKNDIATIDAVRAADAAPPSSMNPEVPAALDAVVMKGLARDPNERWQTAGEMHEALVMFAMSTQPAFGAAQLRAWMNATFADEIASQSAHLQRLVEVREPGIEVSEPSVEVVSSSAPQGAQNPWDDDEPTTVGLPPESSEDYVELSSLVAIEDVVDKFSSVDSIAPPAAVSAEPTPGALVPSVVPAPAVSVGEAPQHGSDAPMGEVAPEAAASPNPPGRVSATAPFPAAPIATVGGPLGGPATTGAPRVDRTEKLPASQEVLRTSPAPEYVSRPTPSPAEPGSGMRWGLLLLVAVLSLVLGVGSVVGWLYLSGHSLPFAL